MLTWLKIMNSNSKHSLTKSSRRQLVESMEKDYKRLVANKKQVQASLNEAKEKLKINEFDKQAIQARNKAESQIEDLDSKISQVTSTLQKYEDLEYSDDLFANLNTKSKSLRCRRIQETKEVRRNERSIDR